MKRARRLTLVVTSLFGGGAERQLVRLGVGMVERGWSVTIVALLPRNDFVDELAEKNIQVHVLGFSKTPRDILTFFKAIRVINAQRPSIVCAFMSHAVLLARVTGKLAGASKVISSLRSPVLGGRLMTQAIRLTDWLSAMTVMNSEFSTESLVAQGAVSARRAICIPNALEGITPSARPEQVERLRSQFNPGHSAFVWLIVGRLEYEKAHDDAFKALAGLLSSGEKASILVVGDGSLRPQLELQATALGVRDHVSFLGYRTDVRELMGAADGLVLPSRWEGLPNVVMEAMLAQLPVVATAVGGTPELIEHGVTGFLVAKGSPEDLEAAMRTVMHLDYHQRKELGEAARDFVSERFAPNTVLDKWERLFAVALDGT